jgi:hypothetical protein
MHNRRFPAPLTVKVTLFDLNQTTSFCDPLSFMHDRSRKEFRHANDDEASAMEWMPARLDGTGWKMRPVQMGWWPVLGVVAGITGVAVGTLGAVAGTPGMDAHRVTQYKVETAHPTDGEGKAGRESYLRER